MRGQTDRQTQTHTAKTISLYADTKCNKKPSYSRDTAQSLF